MKEHRSTFSWSKATEEMLRYETYFEASVPRSSSKSLWRLRVLAGIPCLVDKPWLPQATGILSPVTLCNMPAAHFLGKRVFVQWKMGTWGEFPLWLPTHEYRKSLQSTCHRCPVTGWTKLGGAAASLRQRPGFEPSLGCRLCGFYIISLWVHGIPPGTPPSQRQTF